MRIVSRIGSTLMLVGALSLFLWGCATAPQAPQTADKTPRLVVTPSEVTLGVAKIMGTKFLFSGSGFPPGENVILSISGPKDTTVTMGLARVKADGTFSEEIGDSDMANLVKATQILRADITRNAKMEAVLVISKPPIPAGTYKARATSMIKNVVAETNLIIDEASGVDQVMDWLGKVAGKIVYK